MSATQTQTQSTPTETGSLSITELRQLPSKDAEAVPVDETPASTEIIQSEPATTPVLKLVVAGYSFFCAGVNDGTLGPLIPYILSSFGIGTGEIAIIYATTFTGWLLAALTNPIISAHLTLGQLLLSGALLQLLAHILRARGPFPLFCAAFVLQAAGMAFQDAHSNAFVSGLRNVPYRWLGFIHACYALGLFVGPLVGTGVATVGNGDGEGEGWRRVYFVLVGICVLNVFGVIVAFGDTLWGRASPGGSGGAEMRNREAVRGMLRILRTRTFWLLSLFYFFTLGAGMTAGGWVVEFLTTVRGGELSSIGYVPTGMYGGMLAGRLLLAEPTFRYGEQRMLLVYSALCVVLQLVFWLQPNIVGSAVALSFIGFFTGPFFATGMSVASKLFTREDQPAALGLIFVIAQAGGAIFPSVTGLIATRAGVAVLQPIVLALFVAGGISWWLVPKVPQRDE
ncbi:MFS general substrate transporter [Annulohypoxylon maeteangense]|uniref:MFS general substrate transporter n=1 Tax=Annulohypoxylon maeteangense TaxID=1927788 RepID=UPI0020073937|nr:MFS general substrate transporter [Annulohypoxylon maeteangense]KAI0885284.1 MFS general substrate transporter [Annulohypoxylon maeteangense]